MALLKPVGIRRVQVKSGMTPLLLQAFTEQGTWSSSRAGVMRIKLIPNLMLTCAGPGESITVGGEALLLPHPGLGLDLFVYKRGSTFMNDNREKQRLWQGLDAARLMLFGINLGGFGVQAVTSGWSGCVTEDG